MPATEIDWTFDSIPTDGEDRAQRQGLPSPSPAPRRAGNPWRPHTRFIMALLALAAIGGLGLYLLYRNGWQRVQFALSQEIAYEDTQSFAGNAEAVAALQWPDNQ